MKVMLKLLPFIKR